MRIKEDEKVRGVDQLSGLSNPTLDIPFHDLAVDEVPAEDHESEPEVDELEVREPGSDRITLA